MKKRLKAHSVRRAVRAPISFRKRLPFLAYETVGYTVMLSSTMKKHRNFLVFYSLWLGGIITLLTVFDDTKNHALNDHGNSICMTINSSECAKLSTDCRKSRISHKKP